MMVLPAPASSVPVPRFWPVSGRRRVVSECWQLLGFSLAIKATGSGQPSIGTATWVLTIKQPVGNIQP